MQLTATIVFEKNWDAIHKLCEVCLGNGFFNEKSCHHCGDGETLNKGNGRHYKYIINEGSSRSSKTYSLIDCYDIYARSNQNKRLTAWRDTKTDCKKTILNDTLKHLKTTSRYGIGTIFNKTESIINYETGSTFEIHGTDDEETVHGLAQDAAWLNEPYKISKDTFDQIDQRTSDFIFIDWNPKKAHWIDDLKKDKRSLVIKSTFRDNPFCPPAAKYKILSYQPVKFSDVVINDLISIEDAKTYDIEANRLLFTAKQLRELIRCRENENKRSASEFKWQVYGLGDKAEKPNRIFNWNEIPLDDYLAIRTPQTHYGVDWGSVDPWGIVEVKYYDGALYCRQLNYLSENQWREKMSQTERLQVDADDAGQSNDQKTGIVKWLFQKLSIPFDAYIQCDSNRPTKVLKLRQMGWEYAVSAIKPAGSIIDGIDLLNDIDVYFTSDSEDLKHEQEVYSRKVDRYGVVLDEPDDADNHLIDPIRYVALWLRREDVI